MIYVTKTKVKIEGSLEQIIEVVKKMGETLDASQLTDIPRGYYLSSKSGLIKISDMNDMHIKNALIKCTKSYYENLHNKIKTLSNKDFLSSYIKLTDNKTVNDLFVELNKR